MFILFVVLIVITCILTILIVLVQNSKGGGLASNFSSSNQYMGVRKTADFLEKAIHPQGIAVVVEGLHLCSKIRGVKKAQSRMVTSAMCGSFKTNDITRQEFLSHIDRDVTSVSI